MHSKLILTSNIAVAALAVAIATGVLMAPPVPIKSVLSEAPQAQQRVPQWQIDAGGKMAFDVASVKQNFSGGKPYWNLQLGRDGLFSTANYPLDAVLAFAYKLTVSQLRELQLPKWAETEKFDIQARWQGSPTEDQVRLMMQSLLADRFKLVARYDSRQVAVFALIQEKPGKLGSHLRAHSDNPPCTAPTSSGLPATQPPSTIAGGFPAVCGVLVQLPSGPGPRRYHFGARDMNSGQIAASLNAFSDLDRPMVDQTGLNGTFDFTFDFALQLGPPSPDSNDQDQEAPIFTVALKQQLGFRLQPRTEPLNVLVVDHVEEPSPN